jgi:hypothetical protein
MLSQHPFPTKDIKADKRFDALVKHAMREHEHLLACHHREMQELRDSLKIAQEKFESLSQKNQQDLKDFQALAMRIIEEEKERTYANQAFIFEQALTIEGLAKRMEDFSEIYSKKADLDKAKKTIDSKVDSSTASHLIAFQDFQRELKDLLADLKENFSTLKIYVDHRFFALTEKGDKNFYASRLDKEGIEKELIRYKKAMFYIDKKIENIYTLIERINKSRGESLCHKQE